MTKNVLPDITRQDIFFVSGSKSYSECFLTGWYVYG